MSVVKVLRHYEDATKSEDQKEQKQNLKTFSGFTKIKYLDDQSGPLIKLRWTR